MPTATTNAVNAMLDGLTITHASLHTGYPGLTGTNEVSGGAPAYARQGLSFNAASGGSRTQASAVTFDTPAATIRWFGFWNNSTFLFAAPNGGFSPKEFVVTPSSDLVRCPAHGLANGDAVVFFGGTVPGGLAEGAVVYVVNADTDTFQVSTTVGGAAIDITSYGSSDVQVCQITEQVYASQATHQLTGAQVAVPF